MSRTNRHHLSDGDHAKRGGQPRLRSLSARAAWERGGAGVHGSLKTNKQKRRQDKLALKRENPDA